MGKYPYVSEYQMFIRIDYKHAEEILADYNDFYIFNMAQYANIYHSVDEILEEENIDFDELKRQEMAERNAIMATDHFKALFGSKDFGESSLVGFKPCWYALQKVLLQEYKHKTPIQESAMNGIARYLRNMASILIFAERVITNLEDCNGTDEQLAVLKDGFKLLLDRNEKEKLVIPEYCKTKSTILKFKRPEQFIDFCDKLFKGA